MREKKTREPSATSIRFKYSLSQFKQFVLAEANVATRPQVMSLMDALPATLSDAISKRCWEIWLGNNHSRPQQEKVSLLDRCAKELWKARTGIGIGETDLETKVRGFCETTVFHGLIGTMLSATGAKNVLGTIVSRSWGYQPLSPMHLHLDAMEAAAWSEDFHVVSWSTIATIAGERILQLLADRWSPRLGSVYSEFRSDFSILWEAANEEARAAIKRSCARVKPDSFESSMEANAYPDWEKVTCEKDISSRHVYKLLFSLAADSTFLVEERLEAWALDLATASLAMRTMAWTNRFETMGGRSISPEGAFWAAFREIFFGPEDREIDWRLVSTAAKLTQAKWSDDSIEVFRKARKIYWARLAHARISPKDLLSVAMTATKQHPLVYIG